MQLKRPFKIRREKLAELKFIFKCFLATLLLISLLQIKVGDKTLEGKFYQTLAQSQLTSFLSDVAHRAVHLGRQAKQEIEQKLKK